MGWPVLLFAREAVVLVVAGVVWVVWWAVRR